MCQLYMYINNNAEKGAYKVIIANNRDEMYARPTRPAGFWPAHANCLSGVDLEPGRGNGTWLGMTRQGKVASLLNILESHHPDRTKKSRGHLVNGYLMSDSTGPEYLRKVQEEKDLYSSFNLVTVEKRNSNWCVDFFCAVEDVPSFQIHSTIVCIGNAPYSKPWQKTVYGKEQFTKIVEKTCHTHQRDQLVNSLLHLMKDNSSHLPDPQLEMQGRGYLDDFMLRARSCIFVESPNYGSRTHSFILIDSEDNVEYIEQTMSAPPAADKTDWDTTTLKFKLEPTTT